MQMKNMCAFSMVEIFKEITYNGFNYFCPAQFNQDKVKQQIGFNIGATFEKKQLWK